MADRQLLKVQMTENIQATGNTFGMRVLNSVRQMTRWEQFFLFCFAAMFVGYFFLGATMQRNFLYVSALFFAVYVIRNEPWAVFGPTRWQWMFLGLFWIYNLVSVFWSPGFHAAMFFQYLRYELMAVIFTAGLAVFIHRRPDVWPLLMALYVFTALLVGGVLLIRFAHDLQLRHGHARLQGFGRMKNANMCAALFCVSVLFLCFARDELRRIYGALVDNRFVYGTALGLLLLIIMLTFGRGPVLALAATFLGMAAVCRQYKKLFGLLVLCALAGALIFFNPADTGRIVKRGDDNRFQIWQQAWQYPAAKPVFGSGIATELNFTALENNKPKHFDSTHDLYLGALVYGGAVGLAVLLLAYGGMAGYAFRLMRQHGESVALALVLYGAVFLGFEGHTLIVNLNPEWLFTFVPVAVSTGRLARVASVEETQQLVESGVAAL